MRVPSSLAFAFSVTGFTALAIFNAIGCSTEVRTIDFGEGGTSTTDPTTPATGKDSGTTTTTPPANGTTCEKICAKAASANCSAQASCVSDCEADQAKIPAGCKAEADAVQECAATKATTFECSSKGKPIVKGACDTEGNALVQCVLNGGKKDAGGPTDCGNLTSGSATCDTCVNAKCCAEAFACSNDAAGGDVLDCFSTCSDSACFSKCEADHPAGVAKEKAFYNCLGTQCSAQCN